MARNKECLILILDVRETANEDFKLKAVKTASEVLKDKILSGKKDLVTFILVGTRRTRNICNEKAGDDVCANIVQYPQAQEATWQLFINFLKFVNDEVCAWGDWLDALSLAMDIFDSPDEVPSKFQRSRIMLFYDFNGISCSYDEFNSITTRLLQQEVDLIVVSPNIRFIDNPDSGEPQAIFIDYHNKKDNQLMNEKYALRLVSSANAKLCNFRDALNTVLKTSNRRPWTWNAKLQIGSKINIYVSGIIAVKDESNVVLKQCWGEINEVASRERKYMRNGREIQPEELDLMTGYMLGATPVPFESMDDENEENNGDCTVKSEASLKFIGFPLRKSIPSEYFCGDSLYLIVHQRGRTASAQKLDALVKGLLKDDRAMLCWKIYSAKFNNPKLVVLLPNPLKDDRPASLSMIELAYHAQHHYWDFPTLTTKKTECSEEQLAAIDNLMDSMDLMLPSEKASVEPREMREKDLLPFDTLPHIYEQNVIDFLERRILCNASVEDEQFEEMLEDKNFVEIFWKMPEENEDRAKKALRKVKELFVLEPVPVEVGKAKAVLTHTADGSAAHRAASQELAGSQEKKYVNNVSVETPIEDFKELLSQYVHPQTNSTTKKQLFDLYALQMRDTIWKLIFDSAKVDSTKVEGALQIYRDSCYKFHHLDDYNNWMYELKAAIRNAHLERLWSDVIVAGKLGIFEVSSAITTKEAALAASFYELES